MVECFNLDGSLSSAENNFFQGIVNPHRNRTQAKNSLCTGSRPAWAPACRDLVQDQHLSPWKTMGQKNISAEYCWGMFLQFSFLIIISPVSSKQFLGMPTPPLAVSCTPAMHFPLLPLRCCPPTMHIPKRQVTFLSSLGALLHGLSYS